MNRKPTIFMIIPFEDTFLALYKELKERFSEFYFIIHAGDLDNQQNILQDIVNGISSADVIIADLTGLNANVFYELGLAHAMNKKVVIITQDINDLPFDIKPYRATQYSMQFNKITELYSELEKLLSGAINGHIQFGNPVSDYVQHTTSLEKQNILSIEPEPQNQAIEDEDEYKGFLDFIADIETSLPIITSEIEAIVSNMDKMTVEIDGGTKEINRVMDIGGSSTATFVRNVARKLSEPVNTFATQLKKHVFVISNNWSLVENSYLSILDDKKIHQPDNINGMKEVVCSLESTQVAVCKSEEQIEEFIETLKTCLGMERRLTKAISALIKELQAYLAMTDMIISSVDRIIAKSNIVFTRNQ